MSIQHDVALQEILGDILAVVARIKPRVPSANFQSLHDMVKLALWEPESSMVTARSGVFPASGFSHFWHGGTS